VWSAREQRRIRKPFDRLTDARAWRDRMRDGLRTGATTAPSRQTVQQDADALADSAD
jgi:hypothetical protein